MEADKKDTEPTENKNHNNLEIKGGKGQSDGEITEKNINNKDKSDSKEDAREKNKQTEKEKLENGEKNNKEQKKERGKGDYKQEKKEENKDEGEEEEEDDEEEEEEEENAGEEENNEETKDQEENKYLKQNESKSLYNICDIDFSIGNDNKKSNNNELGNSSEKEEKEIKQKSIGGLSDIKKEGSSHSIKNNSSPYISSGEENRDNLVGEMNHISHSKFLFKLFEFRNNKKKNGKI